MTSYYTEILKLLHDFVNDNIDRQLGELTINDYSKLADDIDNMIKKKTGG